MPVDKSFGFVYITRVFRIVKLFKRTRKYKDIMGPFMFIAVRQLTHFALILFVVLYFYAMLGLELFAATDHAHPPPQVLKTSEDFYSLNNFRDITSSIVTLFTFMFGYTWFFLMDRYARLIGAWSRVYFMGFFLIATVILTIVVASILEAFMFTMSCRRHFLQDCEDQTTITRDVFLDHHELVALDQVDATETERHQALFRGSKLRSNFSFSLQMYAEEVNRWIDELGGESTVLIAHYLSCNSFDVCRRAGSAATARTIA